MSRDVEKTMNRGVTLAESYINGNLSSVVREASKSAGLAVATLVSLPKENQARFAEKIITEGKN